MGDLHRMVDHCLSRTSYRSEGMIHINNNIADMHDIVLLLYIPFKIVDRASLYLGGFHSFWQFPISDRGKGWDLKILLSEDV